MKPPDPITIIIPGEPVSAARARSFIQGGRIVVTTPPKYRKWLKESQRHVLRAMKLSGNSVLTGPASMLVVATFGVPESWPKWKREAALWRRIEHTGKPDLDNVCKAAADCLKGLVWLDDAQVMELSAVKAYGSDPGVYIKITPLAAVPANIASKQAMEAILALLEAEVS